MLRPTICLLLLASLASSENEEFSMPHLAGPLRRLMVRPVASHADVLSVSVGLELLNVDVDEVHDKATIDGWLHVEWNNSRLGWSGGSVDHTRVMPGQMWTPDIRPYNIIPAIGKWLQPTPAIVYSSGKVLYVPPVSFTVRCHRSKTADKDRITCPIKLGSWTYSVEEMDLHLTKDSLGMSDFIANGHWVVESSAITRHERLYDCCSEKYVSLEVELVLKPQHC